MPLFNTSGAVHRSENPGPVKVSSFDDEFNTGIKEAGSLVRLLSMSAGGCNFDSVSSFFSSALHIIRADPKSVITARYEELTRMLS